MSKNSNTINYQLPEKTEESEALVVVSYDMRLVSSLRNIDLKLAGIPSSDMPESLRQLVQENVIPKDLMNPFKKLDKRIRDLYALRGAPSDYGVVISPARAGEVRDFLSDISLEFYSEKERLTETYEAVCKESIKKLRQRDELIRFPYLENLIDAVEKMQPDLEHLQERLQFNFRIVALAAVKDFPIELYQEMQEGIRAVKTGAYGALMQEVAAMANDILDKDQRNGKRTVARVRALITKLGELTFLNPHLGVLAKEMDKLIRHLPVDEKLNERQLADFEILLKACADQHELVKRIEKGLPLVNIVKPAAPVPVKPTQIVMPLAPSIAVTTPVMPVPKPVPNAVSIAVAPKSPVSPVNPSLTVLAMPAATRRSAW